VLRVFRQPDQTNEAAPTVLSFMVGASDTSLIRTETLAGREYTVVPVIALVEGVLQGANSTEPELALFSEFAKFPDSWNGRPVVLRHPNTNGVYVSANSPLIFEDYHMGFMFNTKGEDKRLKTEAWLDNLRIQDLGGEYLDTLTRINDGEVMNVSVGAFIDTRPSPGTFKGKDYLCVWQNVLPDHLALLPDQQGACSVADGCGTNRVAAAAAANPVQIRRLGYLTEGCGGHCCDACASGESCVATNQAGGDNGEGQQAPTPGSEHSPAGEGQEPTEGDAAGNGEGQGEGEGQGSSEESPEVLAAQAHRGEVSLEVLQGLAANALGNEVVLDDAQRLVSQALPLHLGVETYMCDLLAATTDVAVFMAYGEPTLRGFHQIGYSVSNQGQVTFSGTPEPVNLMVRIMPRQTGGVSANSGQSTEEDGAMAENTGQGGAGGNANETNAAGEGGAQGTGSAPAATEPRVETPAAPAAAVPLTVEQYIEAAPAPVRNFLNRALSREEERKTSLITSIRANSRNRFSEDQLKAKDLDELEALAALAVEAPAGYQGNGFAFDADPLTVHSAPAPRVSNMEVNADYLLAAPAGNA
jgi:hypothetical protein